MFRAITETQWKWTRGVALIATLAGFVVPVLSVQAAQRRHPTRRRFRGTHAAVQRRLFPARCRRRTHDRARRVGT
jgi:hypothetical protein